MARKQSFSDKFWHDKDGNFVVLKRPNVFLIIWLVALLFNILLGSNSFTKITGEIGGISLIIWAILEVVRGVNYFWRTIGILVLLLILITRFI